MASGHVNRAHGSSDHCCMREENPCQPGAVGLNAHQPHTTTTHSSATPSPEGSFITAIICPFGPPRHQAFGSRGRPPHRRLQPNPHGASWARGLHRHESWPIRKSSSSS